jgi:hypothetical protein
MKADMSKNIKQGMPSIWDPIMVYIDWYFIYGIKIE